MKKPKLFIKLKRLDNTTRYCRIKLSYGYSTGIGHYYKIGRETHYCHEIHGYQRIIENGKQCIGQIEGNQFAVALWGTPYPDAPGEEHAWLLRTNGIVQIYRTIQGQGLNWLLLALVGVAVIIGGFFIFQQCSPEPVEPTPIEDVMEE